MSVEAAAGGSPAAAAPKGAEVEESQRMLNSPEKEKLASREEQTDDPASKMLETAESSNDEKAMTESQISGSKVDRVRKQLEDSTRAANSKIPIGGIRMPGFLRTAKTQKNKDDSDSTPDQGDSSNPAGESGQNTSNKRHSLLEAIRLPLVAVLPRKFKSKDNPNPTIDVTDTSITANSAADAKAEEAAMECVKLAGDVEAGAEAGGAGVERTANDDEDKHDLPARLLSLVKANKLATCVIAIIILILLILIIALSASSRKSSSYSGHGMNEGPYVNAITTCGPIEGVIEEGVNTFRGVPYALPPVGSLRFTPAQLHQDLSHCWNGTLKVHNVSKPCVQGKDNDIIGDEDCLTLTVYTPKISYHNPLPVVVLIGADSFVGPSPGALDPSPKLARLEDVVIVIPNFRLGVLGFLAHEGLTNDAYPPTSGNYGLSDLVAVLKWIRLNIEHFGGKRDEVTLLGHRAGATLVTALTASRKARGLFSRVWATSGTSQFPGMSLQESQSVGVDAVTLAGCQSFNIEAIAPCLRALPVEKLASPPRDWLPRRQDLPVVPHTLDPQLDSSRNEKPEHQWLVLDGNILQDHVTDAWTREGLHVELVFGAGAQTEASEWLREKHTEGKGIAAHVRARLGPFGLEALERYGDSWLGLASMVSDIRTICPLLTLALAHPAVPLYVVTEPRDTKNLADADVDVDAILGRISPGSPTQRRHLVAMQSMFFRFARTGELEPDRDHLSAQRIFLIGQEIITRRDLPNCDFWIAKDVVPRYARMH